MSEVIWDTLKKAIEKEVRRNDIPKARLEVLPDQTMSEKDFIQGAVETIFHDVSEFYAWYFNPDDDRTIWIGEKAATNRTLQNQLIPWSTDIPKGLREPVAAVVADNLEAMREVDEIPTGQDTDSLDDVITDSLARYIANWSAWYYDRWELDQIENYLEQKSVHEEIYFEDEYGDLSNLPDNSQFDGVTDIPFLAEESVPVTEKQSLSILSMVPFSGEQFPPEEKPET